MQKQERFCGPNKIIEGRRVEKHGNPKQETKPRFVCGLLLHQNLYLT